MKNKEIVCASFLHCFRKPGVCCLCIITLGEYVYIYGNGPLRQPLIHESRRERRKQKKKTNDVTRSTRKKQKSWSVSDLCEEPTSKVLAIYTIGINERIGNKKGKDTHTHTQNKQIRHIVCAASS